MSMIRVNDVPLVNDDIFELHLINKNNLDEEII